MGTSHSLNLLPVSYLTPILPVWMVLLLLKTQKLQEIRNLAKVTQLWALELRFRTHVSGVPEFMHFSHHSIYIYRCRWEILLRTLGFLRWSCKISWGQSSVKSLDEIRPNRVRGKEKRASRRASTNAALVCSLRTGENEEGGVGESFPGCMMIWSGSGSRFDALKWNLNLCKKDRIRNPKPHNAHSDSCHHSLIHWTNIFIKPLTWCAQLWRHGDN